MAHTRRTRRAKSAAIKSANYDRARTLWSDPSEENLAFHSHRENPLAHVHSARSTCHCCAGLWYPAHRETRLNEAAADSLADYIDSTAR